MNFEPLLKFGVDQGASAVHLQAGSSAQLRIGGLIRNVEGAALDGDELGTFLKSIAPKSVSDDLAQALAEGAVFSASVPTAGRFRCALYGHVGGPGVVLRVIPPTPRSVEELNLPAVVRQIAVSSRGLVLVAGPLGSGRTATLAAMVDAVNGAAYQKIVTIENPVEYVHSNKKSLVTQMEVGRHASSFEHGLSLALRQDADVIALGDLSDPSTARLALGAVEAGRKVLAVTTALSAVQALDRLIAMVPEGARKTAVSQLSANLDVVIAQRLAKTRDGKFRPAVEILRGGANTVKAIQRDSLDDLLRFIEGRQGGMQSLDQHLIELNQAGLISGTEAMRLAVNPEDVGEGLRSPRQPTAAAGTADPGLVPL
jgi:twitching motility protein PilT